MLFSNDIKFKGTYRPYQQRVLNNLNSFLDNEKIHVVAPPGSGKTTLGLELIIRLDKPSLILVPSIAIREQWIDRFCNGFLNDISLKDKYISNDIKIQKPIICITYQAFYCAYKKDINKESIDDFVEEESSYEDFDLLKTINDYNIKTICLDECHHLKSEWWKSLETIIKKIKDNSLIALTATPPYDSSQIEWQRYIDLCGPIDEEIFVPELIKDNNLCPHQDYIYYSYPTKQEEKEILKSYANGIKIFCKYKNNERLVGIVSLNKIYRNYKKFKKAFYENKAYYQALVLFLNENKVNIPLRIKLLVRLEKFTIQHMEVLLQNVLFDDQNSYEKCNFLASLKKELAALSVVHNRKVCIVHDDRIDKKMYLSLSKLNSIKEIIKHEYSYIKQKMKCLVLTDYIKIKTKNYIGNNEKTIDSFGTLPIFEYLRRENLKNIKLCCLSGTVCIIPKTCLSYLKEDFTFIETEDNNYVEVVVNASNRKKLVNSITNLFEIGMFNVLIGTKSLLGEGWDSPCINTMIMASFVGSYVLSNQMRGRAIRTDKNDAFKKSNVWHLVCLNPFDCINSYDYINLEKRCNTFIGINSNKHCIENGIDRISSNGIPLNKKQVEKYNAETLNEASNREKVKQLWDECIDESKNIESLSKLTIIPKRRLKKEYSFYSALFVLVLSFAYLMSNVGLYVSLVEKGIPEIISLLISIIILSLFSLFFITNLYVALNLLTCNSKLKAIGRGLLKALIKKGLITSKKCKVKTNKYDNKNLYIYLQNATTYEQNVFSDCISQMLSEMNQPRYILCKPKRYFPREFYVVPDVFKKNKESVKCLESKLSRQMMHFGVVFAKNEYGKNLVLKAQIQQYFKFKNIEIKTKNVLLKATKKDKL